MQPLFTADPFRDNPKYELVRDLERGGFGSVKLARNRQTKQLVAIKLLERGPNRIDVYVERELCNHRLLHHDHVIRFIEAFLTPQYLCIVMEYAAGGNLFDYIRMHRARLQRGFTEDDARWFFWQLMVAVDYCHRKDICNRDIKLENTLVTDQTTRPLLKLCDFGFSKRLHEDSAPHSRVGTVHYMAPEIIRHGAEGYDGKAADVWSCGVMLYAMLYRSYPFARRNDVDGNHMEVAERIRNLDYHIPPQIPVKSNLQLPLSPHCAHLLRSMLEGDPSRRITVQRIFQHPWFLHGVDPRVLTMNDTMMHQPSSALQSASELRELVQAAAAPPDDEFSQHFEFAYSEEQHQARLAM